jgi:hypothetical protein
MTPDVRLDKLADEDRAALAAIVEGPLAWCDPTLVAIATAHGREPTVARLERLAGAGWVAWWRLPGRPAAVTLTPYAAAALHVAIVETGMAELPRWKGADHGHDHEGTPEPHSSRARPDFLAAAGLPAPRRPAAGSPPPRRSRRHVH